MENNGLDGLTFELRNVDVPILNAATHRTTCDQNNPDVTAYTYVECRKNDPTRNVIENALRI